MVTQVPGPNFRPSDLPRGRVAVMFTADWCGYCHRFYAHYKAIREGYVVDISNEDDPLWDHLDIDIVPTVIVFAAGEPARRWSGSLGLRDVHEIQAALSEDLASAGT